MPFESTTGCYISADGRYALYDAEEDLLCFLSSTRQFLRIRGFAKQYTDAIQIGWRLCENTCALPGISICAECNSPIWALDYLCSECRDG